ncbi:MAG: hypothetical protein J6M53_08155 [Bacteroidaceae bacterium]|nr:hypothetical protein [Bacteroidaceae bacterium]
MQNYSAARVARCEIAPGAGASMRQWCRSQRFLVRLKCLQKPLENRARAHKNFLLAYKSAN